MSRAASAGTIHSPAEHASDCDWHFEQYPHECNCGARERIATRNGEAERAKDERNEPL